MVATPFSHSAAHNPREASPPAVVPRPNAPLGETIRADVTTADVAAEQVLHSTIFVP